MNKRFGIIVDGNGDFASLKRRFRNGFKILKTDGPRGHAAIVDDIARKSRKQIGILTAFKCLRVIVLLDFEDRPDRYEDFVYSIRKAFSSIAFLVPVSVAVPNRMIENWYLADIKHLSKNKTFLRNGLKQKNFEGKNGKNELKRRMKPRVSYSETKHGPELFEILRFDIARKNSVSFDNFLVLMNVN